MNAVLRKNLWPRRWRGRAHRRSHPTGCPRAQFLGHSPGASQPLRPRSAFWSHRRPASGTTSSRIRRFLRHQAHAKGARIAAASSPDQPAFPTVRYAGSTMVDEHRPADHSGPRRNLKCRRKHRGDHDMSQIARHIPTRWQGLALLPASRRLGRFSYRRRRAGECPPRSCRTLCEWSTTSRSAVTASRSVDHFEKRPSQYQAREAALRKRLIEPRRRLALPSHDDSSGADRCGSRARSVEYASNCAEPIVHNAGRDRAHMPKVFRHLALCRTSARKNRHPLCRRLRRIRTTIT